MPFSKIVLNKSMMKTVARVAPPRDKITGADFKL